MVRLLCYPQPNGLLVPRENTCLLFATSECAPWIKTGGLADVSAALPAALERYAIDARVLLPAYRPVLAAAGHRREVARIPATAHFPAATLLDAPLPTGVPAWLVHCPPLYDRDAGPYQDDAGKDWPDNATRFGLLARAAALLAGDRSPLDWRPHVLHCNDWQSALAPAYLKLGSDKHAATLICIHNLAFQGLFPAATVAAVELPASSFTVDGVEFYGQLSFLKAGIVYADAIVTVSPTYAREIQSEPLGFGFQGLLAPRAGRLHGIMNGIDVGTWDPASDPHIARRYDATHLDAKRENKRALQARMGLPVDDAVPLFGSIGRLTEQKGVDLIGEIAPRLAAAPAQLAMIGNGASAFEQALRAAARAHPHAIAIETGFDEPLAHLIEAGADAFLMPSRFEPCGLNQMYSQRYGTPPIAHATGGLCDSIVDCKPATLKAGTATGFLFHEPTADALFTAIKRAITAYRKPKTWQALQQNGMARDFSWGHAAQSYAALYASLVDSISPRKPRRTP
jgi:starch synthase